MKRSSSPLTVLIVQQVVRFVVPFTGSSLGWLIGSLTFAILPAIAAILLSRSLLMEVITRVFCGNLSIQIAFKSYHRTLVEDRDQLMLLSYALIIKNLVETDWVEPGRAKEEEFLSLYIARYWSS
uniref:Uncharacterized protein n=1 Tax=Glossina austeni TaxID=7395 RepID=A0A1A9VM10_GLOAU